MIEHLHKRAYLPSHISVLCFFFNNKANDPHKTQIAAIFRSLIFQLWQSLGDTSLMVQAREMICQSEYDRAWGLEYMTDILRSIFTHLSGFLYIVVDAVDECEEPEELIKRLRQLNQESDGKLKILLSSRPEQKVAVSHTKDLGIEVAQEITMADIELYTTTEVNEAIEKGRLIFGSDELKHEVVNTLIKEANGMYMPSFKI